MGGVDSLSAGGRPSTKARAPISLASLLDLGEAEAEALVRRASAREKQKVIAEFITYHQDCLLSTSRLSPTAVSALISFIKTCVSLIDFKLAISKLIELSSYFENTGDIENALLLAQESLSFAENTSDRSLQRKAYGRLATCYSRQFDFENSCYCYEKALKLAVAVGDPVYEFAVLSNIVTLFDAMGLRREASELVGKLSEAYPSGTRDLDLLHLQNSINGYRFAVNLKNAAAMKRFYSSALLYTRTVRDIPGIWKAYLEANTITELIRHGKLQNARRRVDRWARSDAVNSSSRVAVTFLSTSVECAVALADESWLRELEKSLVKRFP